jgi:hypothetical protein
MAETEPGREQTSKETEAGSGSEADADDAEPRADRVDEQEIESFPASDPHSDWSGPAD